MSLLNHTNADFTGLPLALDRRKTAESPTSNELFGS